MKIKGCVNLSHSDPPYMLALDAFIHTLLDSRVYYFTDFLLYYFTVRIRVAGRTHRKTVWRLSVVPAYFSVSMSPNTEEGT